jgi:DNA mismatch repair protein MutL
MPVALEYDGVKEENLALLKALHFDINKVAGKLRLQQVPAGTRHLPWIKWFSHMLSLDVTSVETAHAQISSLISLPAHDIDDESATQVWYWLEQQSEAKQWEYISQFAKVRPISEVLDVWGE